GVSIQYGDFEEIADFVDDTTLVYFDPPYRPLSTTAHFTSYSKEIFDDSQQLRLAEFYRTLDAKGGKLMLSNSDPHNVDPQDDFFERAYQGFRIERLKARRNINRDAAKRGLISELLVLNYGTGQ
ncbi:MAG: DNA adenine methylase, partial [Anaerolineales bacterium]